jgi:hypothetical protein
MSSSGVLSIRDIENALVAKAYKDDAFAAKLKSNPKAALQEELSKAAPGISLPADLKVTVVEESANQLYVVLPAKKKASAGGQLSDQQLELVSGGGYSDEVNTCCMASGMVGEPNWCK